MDDFMRDQVDAVHRQLDAANRWRVVGRRYRLDPPLTRGDVAAAFRAGDVAFVRAPRRRMPIRTILALATMAAASALIAVSDIEIASGLLLQFLAMG